MKPNYASVRHARESLHRDTHNGGVSDLFLVLTFETIDRKNSEL